MCGIIGYVGKDDGVPIIIEGLRKLEYRGYDSAGIAINTGDSLKVMKRSGRLSVLEKELEKNPLKGVLGIGHTRWATHGEPSDVNSHPFLASQGEIALVHNGIVENHKILRNELMEKGIRFSSETDSEVIVQLIEHYYKGNIKEAVHNAIKRLEGSYALGIICSDEPGTLIAVKKDNPLIIGTSDHGNFIASDVPALLKHTNKVYYLKDGEIAVLTADSVEFYNPFLERIQKTLYTIEWKLDSAEKGQYEHYMLKEIMEQAKVVEDTINSMIISGGNKKVLDGIDFTAFNKLVITACGSAYNAGLVAKNVFERLCRLPVEVELASEFRYKDAIVDNKTLVILISQSGETADTIAALRESKDKGAVTLSVVNVIGSTVAKEASSCLYTAAGPEIAVATTKAFSAQLIIMYLIAVKWAYQLDRLTEDSEKELLREIYALPGKITEVISGASLIKKYSMGTHYWKNVFFMGRNIDYAIALEGSLKLKEITYIHSEAYPSGELKHGTISLIEENSLVVAISNCKDLHEKTMSNVEQVISRGAKVLLIGQCQEDDPNNSHEALSIIKIPEVNEIFSPSLTVIVLQLFAYYVALNKGVDIDKPRNLAKSVTVE